MIIDKSVKVEQLKACAETIIKNAESIVGDEQYQGRISVSITLDPTERPNIKIDRDIYPDPDKIEDLYKIKSIDF